MTKKPKIGKMSTEEKIAYYESLIVKLEEECEVKVEKYRKRIVELQNKDKIKIITAKIEANKAELFKMHEESLYKGLTKEEIMLIR